MKTKRTIKQPKLEWKQVYIVKGWQTKIIKGIGVFFPNITEGICTYENSWLVFIDNSTTPERVHSSEVFEDKSAALLQVQKEKDNYLEFCKKQVLEYSNKVTELTK